MHRFLDHPLKTMKESIEPPQATEDPLIPMHRYRPPLTLIPKRRWQQERSESGIIPDSRDQDGREEDRFASDSSSARQAPAITGRSSPSVFNGQPSIAAATILGIITFAALLFLAMYYIRHKRRRRRHKRLTQNQDFGQSEITLGEDTSKTLDDFLMKEVPVERTSFMFSRSQSPSITYVVDQMDRPGLNKQKRNSYGGASSGSLSKLDSLTRISTDGTRPSLLSTEVTATSSQSTTMNSSSKPTSIGSATPRVSMSSSQLWKTTTGSTEAPSMSSTENSYTAPPTSQSSQTWATTTESTETGSMAGGENQSRLSRTSGRPASRPGPLQVGVRRSNADNASLRRYHTRSQSRSSQSRSSQDTIVPPVAESGEDGADPRLSNESTTLTMLRFSEC